MTTIPGHNIVIQQSSAVHEAMHHTRPNQPDPDQLAIQQAAKEAMEKNTVQESTDTDQVKADRERQALDQKQGQRHPRGNKNQETTQSEDEDPLDQDPDSPGRLLDTLA
ncbi:MAG: hypothetical protein V1793_18675 [Pseudomonadota bacterium]